LISDYLTENGIPHVKYQGDMTRTKRDQAVKVFMAKEKARVMLMSLKCGGVGLNLTRANNVISLDLGWSQAVESQAFDRVHRVGQRRKVYVQRVVIADTVEDRILKMQERKQTLADGSLGEGSGKKIGKLSVKELANLFGLDARGRLL
jgi:SNF2 family DNA or RNA helicase